MSYTPSNLEHSFVFSWFKEKGLEVEICTGMTMGCYTEKWHFRHPTKHFKIGDTLYEPGETAETEFDLEGIYPDIVVLAQ